MLLCHHVFQPDCLGALLVNPLLEDVLNGMTHYWVTDQAGYATDLLAICKHAPAGLFTRLVEYAWLTFSPRRGLGCLGRKWHARFDGEVQTHCNTERDPGTWIKHTMKGDRLKMSDEFGLVLRVETIIDQPGEFQAYRERRHRDGSTPLGWFGMCKGVGNLHRYQSHARPAIAATWKPWRRWGIRRRATRSCAR